RYRALLLLNEYYRPDWKASVNGTPVRTFRVNLNQIGVLLNPGNNLIDLQFEPTLYIALIWLQRVAILLLFGYVTYYWLSTRRHIGRVRKWLQANASR
ncbi:MAG: hypothetical protein JO033_02575, partial [Acidobacteriaceae bacterium]|nr:hypothetical protein [Acidobacteriaceae bacterium]